VNSGAAGAFEVPAGVALCLGVFDGVHKGHQALALRCVTAAAERGLIPQALSFDPHPAAFFGKASAAHLLTLPERRAQILRDLGIAETVFARFDQAFADQDPQQFVDWLANDLQARLLVIGPDYRFGKDRAGSVQTLKELAQGRFETFVLSEVADEGLRYRSSEVRQALQAGDLAQVRRLTGRDFDFSGLVVRGQGRGRSLGFATANLEIDPRQMLPADGVYALRVHAAAVVADGVMNLGRAPTLRGVAGQRIPEVHLLDFDGDLYGEELRVSLVQRLRAEQQFEGPEALRRQIGVDVEAARAALI
jgi:riboflavin kinase/FMN adenylyltransferase